MTISGPADVIARLKAVLGEGGWSQDPDRIAPKLVEWRGRWTGTTPLLALPKTTAQVAAVVGICAESGAAATTASARTALAPRATHQRAGLTALPRRSCRTARPRR